MLEPGGFVLQYRVHNDRRRHRRYVLQTPVEVLVGPEKVTRPGRLLDLSAGGTFVSAPVQAEVGAGIFMSFVYWGNHQCEATGQIIRIMPFGAEVGLAIEFVFANDPLLDFVKTYERTADALRPELIESLSQIQLRLP